VRAGVKSRLMKQLLCVAARLMKRGGRPRRDPCMAGARMPAPEKGRTPQGLLLSRFRERSKEDQRGGRILRPGSVHPSGHPLTPQRLGSLAGATHGRLAGATRFGYLPLFMWLGGVASQPYVMLRHTLLDRRGLAMFCQARGLTYFVVHPKECRGRSESLADGLRPLLASADAKPLRSFPRVAARLMKRGECPPHERESRGPKALWSGESREG